MGRRIVGLRRYPVKSMGGEDLRSVEVDERGIKGDRWYAVSDADGRLASGKNTRRFRRRDAVFDFTAHTGEDGEVRVSSDGQAWRVGDPALQVALSAAMAAPVRVVAEKSVPHQDAGAVSLISTATLDWCREHLQVDADSRRLRVNLVVDAPVAFIEESWIGQLIRCGSTVLRVNRRIERCRTIDVAQDGVRARVPWLKPLTQHRDMNVAVYADVVTPGVLSLGEEMAVYRP